MDDDGGFSDMPDCDANLTARAVLQWLHVLAEDAAALGLPRTLDALRKALVVCEAEVGAASGRADPADIRLFSAGNSRIH